VDVAGNQVRPEGATTVDKITAATAPGELRVSDADRDLAVSELSEHFRAGRLTMEELDARTGQALQARTSGELASLFADLPPQDPALTAPPSSGQVSSRRAWCGGLSLGRIALIALVVAAVSSAISGTLAGRHSLGALVPVIVIALIFSRSAIRRSRS
jgi:Domain of unknown function (DUF1707)